ncbi:unnamed protein product [Dicrocoelium dendriticum]|nr:unnamed protein product [Dicrocoelium dendriticum]
MYGLQETLFILIITYLAAGADGAYRCGEYGRWCDGSVFNRCCGNLKCQLKGFANGVCMKCIEDGFRCGRNTHCCSGMCKGFTCQPL